MSTREAALRADALRRDGHPDQALEVYRELLAAEPDKAVHHYRAGVCLQQLERHAEALDRFAEAWRLWPEMGWALYRRAQCLVALGFYSQARYELHRAWDRFAAAPSQLNLVRQVVVLWTRCLEAEGKVEQAVRAARKAVELDPENSFRHYHLGKLLHTAGCPAEAVDAFAAATRLDPAKDYMADRLARALVVADRGAEALEVWRSFPAGRRGWYVHLHLAEFLFARGLAREAAWEAGAAVAVQPAGNPGGWFLLGRILAAGSDPGAAVWCFREAVRDREATYGKAYPEAEEWLDRLSAAVADEAIRRPELYHPGRITRWVEDRGYGFVEGDGESFFFHVSACRGWIPATARPVRFLPALGRKGGEALRLRPLDDGTTTFDAEREHHHGRTDR